ncbi:hypothetical protein [Streptomyces sp. NPDC058279]|uniref:hypothetical protein n=1 Tax=Streptomyces sp. NPDC058279 TaxID=3346418 RepID=UPI0036E9E2CD
MALLTHLGPLSAPPSAVQAVATLGPEGTDAHAEAARLFPTVILTESFDAAMRAARDQGTGALVAAGFVERRGEVVTDLWVDMHFRNHGHMGLTRVWESPTKAMCVATRRNVPDLSAVRTLALHPATRAFADEFTPAATRWYVDAKPLAVKLAADGSVDGCIGSVDIARQHGLEIRQVFEPTMVWCLYHPIAHTGSNRQEPSGTRPKRC